WTIDIYGKWGNQSFFARWEPDQHGEFTGALPKGLVDGRITAISNEHHALRIRLRPDGPFGGCRDLKLGPVDADLPDVEIVKYHAAIVQIAVVDEPGQAIAGAHVAGLYDKGDETYQPVGERPTNI